jgi:hypothetical protein
VIKLVQETTFKEEMLALDRKGEIPRTSKLHNLDLCIIDGVLRVGGRLKNSSLLMGQKHPVLLPMERHITNLIIDHHHKQVHHQRRGQTLNYIRSQGYWIVGGSIAAAARIRNCVLCRKLRRPVEGQKWQTYQVIALSRHLHLASAGWIASDRSSPNKDAKNLSDMDYCLPAYALEQYRWTCWKI